MGKIRHLSDCIDDIMDQIAEIEAAGFSEDNAIKIVSAAIELQRNEGLCEIVKELHEFNLCACSVNAHGEIACPPTIHVKKV